MDRQVSDVAVVGLGTKASDAGFGGQLQDGQDAGGPAWCASGQPCDGGLDGVAYGLMVVVVMLRSGGRAGQRLS
jgi:hypothetical protein